jgi:choline dehydrogenase-like flavoprotein
LTNIDPNNITAEYIVVGSGAGGGTLAARLAEFGHSVLLLEAGNDPRTATIPGQQPGGGTPNDYDVPVFHGYASENKAIAWNFFVRHYASDDRQRTDPNYIESLDGRQMNGILYPRSSSLGGCTAHNAMILVYPHNTDWDAIAELTGDDSWRSEHMRSYFERLERCRYRWFHRMLSAFGFNPTRHGWSGWLTTEKAIPLSALLDGTLVRMIVISAGSICPRRSPPRSSALVVEGPRSNDWRLVGGAGGSAISPHNPGSCVPEHGAGSRYLNKASAASAY